jgi:hypothetical protein
MIELLFYNEIIKRKKNYIKNMNKKNYINNKNIYKFKKNIYIEK